MDKYIKSQHQICINITNRCNLNCRYCYLKNSPKDKKEVIYKEISLDTIKKVINLNNIKSVYLSGGEPLMHPDFFNIVKYFLSKNINVYVATNGLLLNDHMLKKLNGVNLLISLRQEFPQIIDIVKNVLNHNINCSIYFIPTQDNIKFLKKCLTLWPRLKNVKLLYNSTENISSDAWFAILKKVYSNISVLPIYDKLNIDVELTYVPSNHKLATDERRSARDTLLLNYDNKFYSCPLLITSKIGSVCLPNVCSLDICPLNLNVNENNNEYKKICCFITCKFKELIEYL